MKMHPNKYLTAAIAIGNDIILNASQDENGYFWESLAINEFGQLVPKKAIGWYRGTSGVLLFLNALYQVTGDGNYLEYILKGLNWIHHRSIHNPEPGLTLYSGKTGVAYLLISIGKDINEPDLVKKGHELAVNVTDSLSLVGNSDILLGWAGVLQGLMLLYDRLQDDKLFTAIFICIGKLLDNLHIRDTGIFWDKEDSNITGLCGFSHGNAGIGLILIEAGVYFKLNYLIEIGLLAFQYENNYYDKELKNWPDFRKGIYNEEDRVIFIAEYFAGNKLFFNAPGDMLAWCHGAPGILLARYKALDLLGGNKICNENNSSAINRLEAEIKTLNIESNFTLCHGAIGFGLIFLEKYKQTGNEKYRQLAFRIADLSISSFNERGSYVSGGHAGAIPDFTLFNGTSGIGFYYLMVSGLDNIDNLFFQPLLRPSQITKKNIPESLRERSAANIIFDKLFPRTLCLLSSLQIKYQSPIFNDYYKKNIPLFFSKQISIIIASVPSSQKVLKEIYKIEKSILISEKSNSFCYTKAKSFAFAHKNASALSLSYEEFMALNLKKDKTLRILKCKWNWSLLQPSSNLFLKPGEFYRAIQERTDKVKDQAIGFIAYSIISKTEDPISIQKCTIDISKELDVEGATKEEIIDFIIEQIKILLNAGILTAS